jgi:quinol monooxygenase YgiN
MILVTGSVTARDDSFDEVRRLRLEHVCRSRAEPGCLSHAVHVDCENPLRLVFVEQWADRASLATAFRRACLPRFRPGSQVAGLERINPRNLRCSSGGKSLMAGDAWL